MLSFWFLSARPPATTAAAGTHKLIRRNVSFSKYQPKIKSYFSCFHYILNLNKCLLTQRSISDTIRNVWVFDLGNAIVYTRALGFRSTFAFYLNVFKDLREWILFNIQRRDGPSNDMHVFPPGARTQEKGPPAGPVRKICYGQPLTPFFTLVVVT